MPRPIEYDRERVLEGVMKTFWEKGYDGTSISDLVKATRLNTRTMYNLFGDKRGLYLAALENYRTKHMRDRLTALKTERGFRGIRNFFNAVLDVEPVNSCLFANTLAEESGVIGDRCREFVDTFFGRLEQELVKNLEQAKEDGEFAGDSTTTAQALICFLQGMGLFSKLHPSTEDRRRLVALVIDALAG